MRRPRSPNAPLAAVAAGLALADTSIVTLALPQLLAELDATVEGVSAVLAVYTVVLAAALIPAERLSRRTGSARLGAAGLAVFGLACVGCAAAESIEALLLLRAVQAAGAAGALVAAFEALDAGDEQGRGRRLWTTASVIGFATGPALGGVLTQAFDWRSIFVLQVPVAAAAALSFARAAAEAEPGAPERSAPARADGDRTRVEASLALLSAALTAVLFLLVLLLVAGWNMEPLTAAITVSVLPLAALAAGRVEGQPRVLAATGCLLVGAGVLALAFLPGASAWWTVVPQLIAGFGMGLALPALAGRLLPERDAAEAARLLTARHAGIALALILLAPILSSNLESATSEARQRGVALVLDSELAPLDKLRLAPDLLGEVDEQRARDGLTAAIEENRDRFGAEGRAEYDRLADRADETLVSAVADALRNSFLIAAAFALLAALAVLPAARERPRLARVAAVAAAVPLLYVLAHLALAPDEVEIADPCKPRTLPRAEGITGVLQSGALGSLDQIACQFGASREELVLAIADEDEGERFRDRHGVNPRSAGNLIRGLLGE